MKNLRCLQEYRVEDTEGNLLEKYEDGFNYVYEVDDEKADLFLTLVDPQGRPYFVLE